MDERERVRHIARLARLEIRKDDLEVTATHFGRILEMFARLDEIDVDRVPPTHDVAHRHDVLRDDRPRPSLDREAALANGTDVDGACFRVAKILDESKTRPADPDRRNPEPDA